MKFFLGLALATVLQGQIQNDLSGCIGVELKSDMKTVAHVKKGSPADLAGIVKKDQIEDICDDAGNKASLEGPIGETVVIRVKRRECMYTSRPWKSCPYCNGHWDIDVIRTFVVERVECGN